MKDLFGDELPAKKPKPNQTVYYLSVSAMQKCIRRGDAERAVNFARVAYRQNSYKTFCRLWTILFEDCGTSIPSLEAFNKYPIGEKTFENLIPLITAMADSVKDTDTVYVSNLITGNSWNKTLQPIPLYLALKETPYSEIIEWYKAWPERKLEVFDSLDYDDSLDWLPRICKLGHKFDYSKFALGTPILIHSDVPTTVVESKLETPLYKNFLPLVSVDIHTRQGNFALNVLLKRKSSSLSKEAIKYGLFYSEGLLHDKRAIRKPLLRDILWNLLPVNHLKELLTNEPENFWRENLDEFNAIREWVLDTHFQDDVELLQSEYEKDFINVEKEKPNPEPIDSRR